MIKSSIYKYFIAFSSIIYIAGCRNLGSNKIPISEDDIISIKVPSIKKEYSLIDTAADILDMTILQPDPSISESLLSDLFSIKKILYLNNTFFLLDTKFMTVNAFDKEGKYLYLSLIHI